MKTEFQLEFVQTTNGKTEVVMTKNKVEIKVPNNNKPYVVITMADDYYYFIQDRDLERFAVNILKALKSKKLKV